MVSASIPPVTVQSINPQEILFSMPTIAVDDLQFGIPTEQSFHDAPKFHEDEWMQLEFFSQEKTAFLEQELKKYKEFESKNRTPSGWKNIYARKIPHTLMITGENAVNDLAKTLNGTVITAPILFSGSEPLGQVEQGFGIKVDDDLLLYGTKNDKGIMSLAGLLIGENGNAKLAQTFMQLAKVYQFVLVDWRGQQLLLSNTDDGQIQIWKP